MTKQEKIALNMAKFIQAQTLLLLEKLNELNIDEIANKCERLHELSGVSLEIGNFCTLSALFNQSWFVRG